LRRDRAQQTDLLGTDGVPMGSRVAQHQTVVTACSGIVTIILT
jgi:hypothetical protein